MTTVHVVVPDGIDDPRRPSGGNLYDRRLCRGLTTIGWTVQEHPVAGDWPRPGTAALAALAEVVRQVPDDGVALIDGLVASAGAEVLVPQARRLRLVVLVHMALGDHGSGDELSDVRRREGAVLAGAAAVVVTSAWARRRLLELYPLSPERVHVAPPGVDRAELALGTPEGGAMLCVAAVTAGKGHDVLVEALAATLDLAWRCVCVGSLDREPGFVEDVRVRSRESGVDGRLCWTGPRTGRALDRCYAAADLMVLASRAETYGMVVTEALARGLPVIATEVGGVPEALGHGAAGTPPGRLVAPGDALTLAAALRAWLSDAGLRERWRRAARERRASLTPWSTTTAVVAGVLAAVAR